MRACLGLCLVLWAGCQEERPPLVFRKPQLQSAPSSLALPPPETRPASTLATSAPDTNANFSCEINGAPWVLSPTQKVQGLLLERPAIEKERPPTRLITISLQSTTQERLLIEIVADKEPLESAKLTLTTRSTVAKASTTLKEVTKKEEPEHSLLSFSFDVDLQPLGGGPAITTGCSLQEAIVRSLKTEVTPPEE